jgi:hypothetical protein
VKEANIRVCPSLCSNWYTSCLEPDADGVINYDESKAAEFCQGQIMQGDYGAKVLVADTNCFDGLDAIKV